MASQEKTILIIDDDESILEVIKVVLELEGYKVIQNSKGDYFQKESYKTFFPDLVLLDVMLSGTSGREICKQIRANKETTSIPVLILSAHSEPEVKKTAEECGANGYLLKPFDIESLSKIIKKHLN